MAALDADAFADFFASLDLGPNATIAVRRGDGTLLLREPLSTPLEDAGREIDTPTPQFPLLAGIVGNTFRVGTDGILRTYSMRTLPGHDIGVYVGIAMTDLTATVWRDAAPFIFAIAGMSLPMIVLFGIAYRTIKGNANDRIALLARAEDLEETVRQRTRELEVQSARLRESNGDLERFAYSVSHDLQEPLRMVSSFLTLLERHAKDKLDAKEHEFVGFAVDGAERMRGMIAALLAYSRVETQGRPLQEVDAGYAVETARANLRVALSSAGATLDVGPLPLVRADAGQLISLFQNLIGNAIKYRHPDRPVHITVAAERLKDHWRFTVADNGLGIPEDQHERIFDVFYRLHARDAIEGTGIGLALCKRIVDRHGGTIRVVPTEGHGTTLALTFPAGPAA